MTATLDFMVLRAQSETFNTALYRFLELRQGPVLDVPAMLKSEPHGPVHKKTVTLWNDDAP